MKNLIQKIKDAYYKLSEYNNNQWKHWSIGILFTITLLIIDLIFTGVKFSGDMVVFFTFILMVLFESFQQIGASVYVKSLKRPNTYRLIDSIFDILIGVSGSIFVIYLLRLVHLIK